MNIDNLFDRIPQWLKSLHEMENELRNAARMGLILRREANIWRRRGNISKEHSTKPRASNRRTARRHRCVKRARFSCRHRCSATTGAASAASPSAR